MLKRFFPYLLLCLLFPLFSLAQQEESVRGILFKKGMLEKIAGVTVTNTRTKAVTTSNLYGEFNAKVITGDTLTFEKEGLTTLKQSIASYSTMYLTMLPEIKLNQVNVMGQSKKQELNDVMADYRKKGLYFNEKTSALAYAASPLTGLHELFGRDAKNRRNFAKYAKDEMQQTEINRRYTPQLVTQVTGLTGSEVKKFMNNYSPTIDEVKKWNDYDLIQFIKRSYEGYKSADKEGQSAAEVFGTKAQP
ncbi:hypothetical protein MUY27_02030 [Mucilaginibacter sp. RS28]|uniref:CarboxypepD_reg-like domain-containing protein n=1 Tax=Mucilaginibacter straminoryzae TaxID=2932774 RepID=A0A9X2B7E8_9SPHI|nr:hypothetical protein [Mucilaginibacter straminoryzae]MCJ8208469.1 hypothetical protein [Mucilaginibacter straminoryzae]